MPALNQIRSHQRVFLDKAKARTTPLNFAISGVEITVNPGVFPPATDTKLLAEHVQVAQGQRIIDVTTGSGVIPIIAGLQGATGFAIDINPRAVQNARENIERYGVAIEVVESDLFSNIPPAKFDVIFANGPFFEGRIEDPMDYACYGARNFIEKLFAALPTRLKPDGKLLLVTSQWADLEHLTLTAEINTLQAQVIATKNSDDGERTYLLYEIILA